MDEHLFAVIMAGGSGTRFWPASRRERPKQFLAVAGERPLIAQTAERLDGMIAPERTLVVTAAAQAELVRECLPELPAANILLEPMARNTAPCVALAALEVARRDPGAVQCVLPADHVIRPAESFRRVLAAAAAEARRAHGLVTLGVVPDRPATGYGYIEQGEQVADHGGVPAFEVVRFVEKPDEGRAREFLACGSFRWNAGIFVWETSAVLAALERHAPAIHTGLVGVTTPAELERAYADLPATPIDKAVMEKATNRSVLPIDCSWSDVGTWPSLSEVVDADASGNCVSGAGEVRLLSTSRCIVHGDDGMTALIDVEDLVVVRTGDATLICSKERAEDVKKMVERLEREGGRFL